MRTPRAVVAALLALGTAAAVPAATAAGTDPACPWVGSHASPDARAHQVLARMTLGEKVGMLYGRGDLRYYGTANEIPAIPRLCVPQLVFNDAGAGVSDAQVGTTPFPDPIVLASSWDPALAEDYGRSLGWEAYQKGINVMLAPGVNVGRVPMNGRNFEYLGEDPLLAGRSAAAVIRGIQQEPVVATVKHYVLNSQETDRMTASSDVDERTLHEVYLPPFEAAVKAGVGSVMCSYNRIGGTYACEDPYTLTGVLKGELGFRGWVMSDWTATHSTVKAANAGLDQEQGVASGQYFSAPLEQAVRDGKVSMHRLDDMVLRILRTMFRLGIFEHPVPAQPQAFGRDVNTVSEQEMALRVAEAGTVLLKNAGHVLPLAGQGQRIAVIGAPAGPHGAELTYQGGGSSHVPLAGYAPGIVSPLEGIEQRAAANGDVVTYADGQSVGDAVAAAAAADVAVVFASDGVATEGVDRPDLRLHYGACSLFGCQLSDPNAPNSPDNLVKAVAGVNKHTVVVLQTGGPVEMPWLSSVAGVLETWYPGQQDGDAVAAVLYGDVDPSAKLPFTFPKSIKDIPTRTKAQYPGVGGHVAYTERLLVGYKWYDAEHIAPLFPFGFGLSYTSFRYSGLRVRPDGHGGATVSFTVTNTGRRTGSDVAQVYVGLPRAAGEPPRLLRAFRKVRVSPGASQRVGVHLDARAFSVWDTSRHAWREVPGTSTVYVGDSSRSLPLRAAVRP